MHTYMLCIYIYIYIYVYTHIHMDTQERVSRREST